MRSSHLTLKWHCFPRATKRQGPPWTSTEGAPSFRRRATIAPSSQTSAKGSPTVKETSGAGEECWLRAAASDHRQQVGQRDALPALVGRHPPFDATEVVGEFSLGNSPRGRTRSRSEGFETSPSMVRECHGRVRHNVRENGQLLQCAFFVHWTSLWGRGSSAIAGHQGPQGAY